MKYFKGNVSGRIYDEMTLNGRVNVTEVQVVPLDAIVIRREDLPVVEPDHASAPSYRWAMVDGATFDLDRPAAERRATALRQLALAAYTEEHPPVDEAQVKALADLLSEEIGKAPDLWHAEARRLVERGARVEVDR